MKSPSSHWSSDLDQDFIDKVLVRQAGRPGALLAILQQVQNNHPRKFLPPETLEYIAAKTAIPLSRIFSVATFYALFNLEPQGRDTISVCRGTACHTRGSRDLFEKVMMNFGFPTAPRWRAGPVVGHHCRRQHNLAHRRLLRPVRAGAGRRSESRDLRPHERARHCSANWKRWSSGSPKRDAHSR